MPKPDKVQGGKGNGIAPPAPLTKGSKAPPAPVTKKGKNPVKGEPPEPVQAIATSENRKTTERNPAPPAPRGPVKKKSASKGDPSKQPAEPGPVPADEMQAEPLYPWFMQPGESLPAYEAFRLFRMRGFARTQIDVARALGKNASLIYTWGELYQWKARAEAYDRHMMRIEQAEEEKVRKEAVRDQLTVYAKARKLIAARFDMITPGDLEALSQNLSISKALDSLDRVFRQERLALGIVDGENSGGGAAGAGASVKAISIIEVWEQKRDPADTYEPTQDKDYRNAEAVIRIDQC